MGDDKSPRIWDADDSEAKHVDLDAEIKDWEKQFSSIEILEEDGDGATPSSSNPGSVNSQTMLFGSTSSVNQLAAHQLALMVGGNLGRRNQHGLYNSIRYNWKGMWHKKPKLAVTVQKTSLGRVWVIAIVIVMVLLLLALIIIPIFWTQGINGDLNTKTSTNGHHSNQTTLQT